MNKVEQGQSFIDRVLQQTGDIIEVLEMAILNDRSITDEMSILEVIKTTKIVNAEMVQLFANYRPATNILSKEGEIEQLEGIGYWIIERNFIVS